MIVDLPSNTYVALVVFEIFNNTLRITELYREDIVLQSAPDIESAERLVIQKSIGEEVIYENIKGESIQVRFLRIQDISEVEDSVDIYSRHFKDLNVYNELNDLNLIY